MDIVMWWAMEKRDRCVARLCHFMPRWVTPNVLTAMRMILAPFFFFALLGAWWGAASVLFILGAAFDFVDGPLARQRRMVSAWGAALDPIADKLFFLPPFAWLLMVGASSAAPFVIVLLLLEAVLVTLGIAEWRFMRRKAKRCHGANHYGKVKTTIEALIVALMLIGVVPAYAFWTNALFLAAIFAAIGSIGGRVYFLATFVAPEDEIEAIG